MKVERLKYVIWAADMNRAVNFYATVFGGAILKQNDIISEVCICDGIIGIHGGGEGNRTWTGLCNAPLKVRREPLLFRRLVDGVCCIG